VKKRKQQGEVELVNKKNGRKGNHEGKKVVTEFHPDPQRPFFRNPGGNHQMQQKGWTGFKEPPYGMVKEKKRNKRGAKEPLVGRNAR